MPEQGKVCREKSSGKLQRVPLCDQFVRNLPRAGERTTVAKLSVRENIHSAHTRPGIVPVPTGQNEKPYNTWVEHSGRLCLSCGE